MRIEQGLFDHIVLQRTRRNVCEAAFSGTCDGNGLLRASVRKGARIVPGYADVKVGLARRGHLSGCLKGLPAGGPYEITLRLHRPGADTAHVIVKDVLVGDVWLLGGQSNMQGAGLLKEGPKQVDPMVRAFYMNDCWGPAKETIHNMWETVDQVHIDLCGGVRPPKPTDGGVGPGVAFGHRMREITGVPQGLIACAHGGTSMSQWDPKLKHLGNRCLYGALLRRFQKNGSKVAGLVWYQGESDANADAAPLYMARMKQFIAALRRDCEDRNLPVAIVQISRVIGWPEGTAAPWNSVQDQERRMPGVVRNCAVVPAIDLTLVDAIHISGRDQGRLGRRLAQAMASLTSGPKAARPPIALGKISIVEARGLGNVIVEFNNVEGRLQAASRPVGFAIVGRTPGPNLFDVELSGKCAVIRSTLTEEALGEMSLHYGYGTDPVCNITDSGDRSVPVFGPAPIGRSRAISPFVRTLRVSGFQSSAGKLDALAHPAATDSLGFRERSFPADFCDLHAEIGPRGADDPVVFYASAIECPQRMRLAAVIGYDGPVKVWVDGRQRFHDPNGTNPARPNAASIPFAGTPGRHEILVALGANKGAAWGIFLRFERLDVTPRQVRKGPGAYLMPRVLG